MTQSKQRAFHDAITEAYLLSDLNSILDFIRINLSPDEVFSQTTLRHFFEDVKGELENKLPVNY